MESERQTQLLIVGDSNKDTHTHTHSKKEKERYCEPEREINTSKVTTIEDREEIKY